MYNSRVEASEQERSKKSRSRLGIIFTGRETWRTDTSKVGISKLLLHAKKAGPLLDKRRNIGRITSIINLAEAAKIHFKMTSGSILCYEYSSEFVFVNVGNCLLV